jgi:MFS transporter, DHA2 family, lincomycin resistance protein
MVVPGSYACAVTERAGYPAPTASAVPPPVVRLDPQHRLVITLLLVSAFVVILNETVMGVALSRIMTDLGIEATSGQWLTTAFMLTMAIVIPTTGFIMQRLTTRTVFILAMSLFTAGTAIAAVAPGFEVLLAGRIVQAGGTAIMMPLLMTTVMTLVPVHERGKMMGNISIVMAVAPAVGPTVGGLIVQNLDWRFIFILVLPIAVTALVLGIAKIQNVSETRKAPLDFVSVVIATFAFGGLIFGLSSLGEAAAGHQLMEPWIPLTVGGIALAVFIIRQITLQRADRALLDLRTFTHRGFSLSVVLMVIMMAAMFGAIIVLPIYTQDVLGLEPAMSGLILLPGSLLQGAAGPIIGRLYDRVGPRPLLVPGAIVVSGMLWLMTTYGESTSWVMVLLVHIGFSIGLSLMFTPLFTTALGSVPPKLYSYGSATIGTVQQVAGAAGTAMFIALLTIGRATAQDAGLETVPALAAGIHSAFIAGAIVSLLVVVVAFFVPKPSSEFAAPAGAGH